MKHLALAAAVLVSALLVACNQGADDDKGGDDTQPSGQSTGTGAPVVAPSDPSPEDDATTDDPPPVLGSGIIEPIVNGPPWLGFGANAQHSGSSQIATQDLGRIKWRAAIDMVPQYSAQGELLIHYGSPVITSKNTVIMPVKRQAQNGYVVKACSGSHGELLWTMSSDYVVPAHGWTPSFNVTLTSTNRVYVPGLGGRVLFRDNADAASSVAAQSAAFYGDAAYAANKAVYDANVFVDTPIVADYRGTVFFGFSALAGAPGGLTGGIARVAADGTGSWVSASALASDTDVDKAAMNSAPALSQDQVTLYVVVNGPSGKGYLLALDAATLALKNKVLLLDPDTSDPAIVSDDSTASPTIAPDGDVFFGVSEANYGQHNGRGWLLHFDASLAQTKMPGSFGWDATAAIVPSTMVSDYTGSSQYLVTTNYANYAAVGGGDGRNRVALLDPSAGQGDAIASGVTVMTEVKTILGVTPDPEYPGAVVEWGFNVAAVDSATKSILLNSNDGWLYRWDLRTNALSQKMRLTSGLPESYTPLAIGADGTVYAINNAILFAVGR